MAIVIALVTATAAGAARPVPGQWYNDSQARGGFMETSKRNIRTLWLFCRSERYENDPTMFEYRASRYEIPWRVRVGRDGRFAYRGRAYRYGAEGQPLGSNWTVRLKGRFVSPRKARIERTLEGCDTAKITIRHDG